MRLLTLLILLFSFSLPALNQVDSGILHMNGAVGESSSTQSGHQINYDLKANAIIGTWHKLSGNEKGDYLQFNIAGDDHLDKLLLKVELKGSRGIQHINLQSKSHSFLPDWDLLGDINELVFLVHNPSKDTHYVGKLDFAFELKNWSEIPKLTSEKNRISLFNLNSAKESGALAMDGASSFVKEENLDFHLPQNDIAGTWHKGFDATITQSEVIHFQRTQSPDLDQLTWKLEIKGSKSTQVIDLTHPQMDITTQWQTIGEPNEIVLLIFNHSDNVITARGNYNLDFQELSLIEKVSSSHRHLLIIIFALLGLITMPMIGIKKANSSSLAQSLAISLIAISTFLLYGSSDLISLERSQSFILLLALNLIFFLILQKNFCNEKSSFKEALVHSVLPGFIILSVSSNPIWAQPNELADFAKSSGFGAACLLFVYQLANYISAKHSGRLLKSLPSWLITLVPILFSSLLALQNQTLLLSSFGSLPEAVQSWKFFNESFTALSRLIIVFFFSEIVINAFSLLCKRHVIYDRNAHKKTFQLSFALILSPFIADLGSAPFLADYPRLVQAAASIVSTIFSQGMLWAYVFMITGVLLDAVKGQGPAAHTIHDHAAKGRGNGRMYAGSLMFIIQTLHIFANWEALQGIYQFSPFITLSIAVALLFPLIKTIIESFDGSHGFLPRCLESYKKSTLYARGLVLGSALALGISWGISSQHTGLRALFGFCAGALAFAGINYLKKPSQEKLRSLMISSIQGGFIGAAMAFYLDAGQVPVIIERFNNYNTFGIDPKAYQFDNLLSKWGHIKLGDYTGGSKLLFNQALNGVIGWGVAAWLFALNQSLLKAIFTKNSVHLLRLASRDGMIELAEGTIRVLRWGLWMSPVIFTFLRQMPDPTWYNQDGAIRTLFCIGADATMSAEQFHSWSLEIFMWVMAYEGFRILIWLDHMGLRVATLVNLSFIGMDSLDNKFSRFIDKTGQLGSVIPEGVKRFMTWAPLLIPYYIPRSGNDWDYAWNTALDIQGKSQPFAAAYTQPLIILSILAVMTLIIYTLLNISAKRRKYSRNISNSQFQISLDKQGYIHSAMHGIRSNITATRSKSENTPGLQFYLRENKEWTSLFKNATSSKSNNSLVLKASTNDLQGKLSMTIPVKEDAYCELELFLTNLHCKDRKLELMAYSEWALDSASEDLIRQKEERESQEILLEPGSNAIYVLQPTSSMFGYLASQEPVDQFLRHRFNNGGNMLEQPKKQRHWHSDPATGLVKEITLKSGETITLKFAFGCAFYEAEAINLIKSYLRPKLKTQI